MRELNRPWELWWRSADGIGEMACGRFLSRGQAEADIAAARSDLLDQCEDAEERAGIEAGSFVICKR